MDQSVCFSVDARHKISIFECQRRVVANSVIQKPPTLFTFDSEPGELGSIMR